VLARQVDVLASPVYYWREREGGELSITQRRWELKNIRDRADSAAAVLDFLKQEAPELLPVVEQHLLHIDVSAIAAALHENDPSEHEEILGLAERISGRTSEASRRAVIQFERVQNDLLARKRLAELEQLMDYRAEHGTVGPLRREGRLRPRFYMQLPFLDDSAAGVPREHYQVPRDEAKLMARVRDAAWTDGKLSLDLVVGIRGFRMTDQSTVTAWLERTTGRRSPKISLDVERYASPRPLFGEDLSGARVTVDPRDLGRGELPEPGFWQLNVRVTSGGVRKSEAVRLADPGRTRWAPGAMLPGGLIARTDISPAHGFGIQFRRPGYVVTACEVDGSDLVVRGRYRSEQFDPAPVLRLWVDDGSAEVLVPASATRGPAIDHEFTARFAVGSLVSHQETDPSEERAAWLVRILVHGRPQPLAVPPSAPLARVTTGTRRVSAESSVHGNLLFHEGYAHPLIDGMDWVGAGRLRLSGLQDRTPERPETLVARRYVTPADRIDVPLQLTWADNRFETEADVTELVSRAAGVVTGDEGHSATPWEFLMDFAAGLEPAHADTASPERMAAPHQFAGHHVRSSLARSARLRLLVE